MSSILNKLIGSELFDFGLYATAMRLVDADGNQASDDVAISPQMALVANRTGLLTPVAIDATGEALCTFEPVSVVVGDTVIVDRPKFAIDMEDE